MVYWNMFGNPLVLFGHGLLAEFLIRSGYLNALLAATAVPEFPVISMVEVLTQIGEMVALNKLFNNTEYLGFLTKLAHLRQIAERQTWETKWVRGRGGHQEKNPHYKMGFADAGNAIVKAIDGILEECHQARYWYLKGVLQELPNLEIEGDKTAVEGFLVKLGFSGEMLKSLNAAESDYKSTATTFELKNCLGHLRSFLEHLHRDAAKSLASAKGATVVDKWGSATLFLRQEGYFHRPT